MTKAVRKIHRRKTKERIEDLVASPIKEALVGDIAKSLAKQIDKELFTKKYARTADILKLVGAGVFLAGSIVVPGLPLVLKPFLDEKRKEEYEIWKRFNIPYLRRTIRRLEREKFVEIAEEQGFQVVKITEAGRRRILKFAIDELAVRKPSNWDRKWRLVSYDVPGNLKTLRNVFREYLRAWGFYPLHESVFLHAYPCEKHIEFLREYLGIGEYVRIFTVAKIENDGPFRKFFGV